MTLRLSDDRPLLVVLEDAHWIDPTTEELLTEFANRIARRRVLLVVTMRPDREAPFADLSNRTLLLLNRISREQSRSIALAHGAGALPAAALEMILDRADGVPLYVEELTKAVLASKDDHVVPTSIQSMFVARLDQLAGEKRLAQIMSALGRTFTASFVEAVTDQSAAELAPALDRLVASGLMMRRGEGGEARLRFKHALIQEAAYETLLFRTRRDVHSRVADVLLSDFAALAESEPESVARHLSLADRPAEAVGAWRKAGERFAARSAHKEAVEQFRTALSDLAKTEPSPGRSALEFDLRIALNASLLTVEGWSGPNVANNYETALALSQASGDMRQTFVALRGKMNVHFLNGELAKMRTVIAELMAIAERSDDAELLNEAYRSDGMCALHEGDFLRARIYLERANALYDRHQHHRRAFVYGTDPGVVGLAGLGWAHWFIGDEEEAATCSRRAIALARDVAHPFSLAYAEGFAACQKQFARDAAGAKVHADRLVALAEEHRYAYWVGWGKIVRGWAVAHLGDAAAGYAEISEGIAAYESTGAKQILPYAKALHAECAYLAGAAAALDGEPAGAPHSESRFYSSRWRASALPAK